jgi:hypothetical protein
MRLALLGVAAPALIAAISSEPARSYDLPYDPYPWCAFYSGDGSGGTNCGFLTLEQCRATVSPAGQINSTIRSDRPRVPASVRSGSHVFEGRIAHQCVQWR